MPQAPKDYGPTLRMAGLVVVAFLVGGGGVYGAAKLMSGGGSPPVDTPVQQVALVTEIPTFTDADLESCKQEYRRQFREEQKAGEDAMLDGTFNGSSGSGAVAPMAAQIVCMAEVKPERFCDPEQRAVFVGAVKEYLEQAMFISAIAEASDFSVNVYMPMVAGIDHEGTDVINNMTKGVRSRMMVAHQKVATELRELVGRGLLREEDFSAFMGFGVPEMVKRMLEGAEPGPSACG